MAERIVKEESLVAVADAIRAKGGTTDPLSFPTGFADAISAIQAGGGGVSGGVKANFGTFTVDETITATEIVADDGFSVGYELMTINHNSGFTPKHFIVFSATGTSGVQYELTVHLMSTESKTAITVRVQSVVYNQYGTSASGLPTNKSCKRDIEWNENTITLYCANQNPILPAGKTYWWVAIDEV